MDGGEQRISRPFRQGIGLKFSGPSGNEAFKRQQNGMTHDSVQYLMRPI